jgi:hypothetical protein
MGCATVIQDDIVHVIHRGNWDCHGKVAQLDLIGVGLNVAFGKSGQQIWTTELCLVSLSKARYAASSLGNIVELKGPRFFHSSNVSLFDRFISLYKASPMNLCHQSLDLVD